jgi:hypothetical protein
MPEAGSLSSQASTVSSHTEVLARESPADEVNGGKFVTVEFRDVVIPWGLRPMAG